VVAAQVTRPLDKEATTLPRDENEPDVDSTLSGDPDEPDILIHDGTYMCMLGDNHLPTFGVLVHDVTEDNLYGTCIIADGNLDRTTFQNFSYNTLYKAMIRNKEQTYRLLCPTSKLKRLLATETHDEEALNERITESYNTYAEKHPSESLSTEVTRRHVSKTHMENAESDTFYGAPESDDFLSDDVKSSNCVVKRIVSSCRKVL
jgi:hypothetical protein